MDNIERVLHHMSIAALRDDAVYFREQVRQAKQECLPPPHDQIHCCEECRFFARIRSGAARCHAPQMPPGADEWLTATNGRNQCPAYEPDGGEQ
ncbi:hypothetical protein [Cupriavidus metallidurans]|uniref:hypothetical protein n=1 Tax=Cupriavidus metallidurans TaxID=119219 RepID=UPI0016450C96|nr:hypothetical protein [Cupriavidus metallidurans]